MNSPISIPALGPSIVDHDQRWTGSGRHLLNKNKPRQSDHPTLLSMDFLARKELGISAPRARLRWSERDGASRTARGQPVGGAEAVRSAVGAGTDSLQLRRVSLNVRATETDMLRSKNPSRTHFRFLKRAALVTRRGRAAIRAAPGNPGWRYATLLIQSAGHEVARNCCQRSHYASSLQGVFMQTTVCKKFSQMEQEASRLKKSISLFATALRN